MILVDVNKISYDPSSRGYLLVLKSLENNDFLEILISTKDAKQISLAKEGVSLPRPATHDLLLDIVNNFDIKLKKIIIVDYRSSTYYAKLILYNTQLGEFVIDSRPSDAIVLSLKSNCPLYVNKNLLSDLPDIINGDNHINSKNDSDLNEKVDVQKLIKTLNKELDKAVITEEYETAAKIRDKIISLTKD